MAKTQVKLQQIQRQALSPLQKLSGELLELPSDELEKRIEKEKEENPYLEEEQDFSTPWFYSQNDNIPTAGSNYNEQLSINTPATETLAEDLLNQLSLSNITEEEYKIGELLIGNLDERGYFTRSLTAIIDDIYFDTFEETDVNLIEKVLKLIQSFEPAGVGARNHQECLYLQLQRLDTKQPSVEISKQIILNYWEEFCNKDFKTLKEKLSCEEEELKTAFKLIQNLNLSPGQIDNQNEKEQYITPDVIMWNNNGQIKYVLNKISNRKLYVNQDSQKLLKALEEEKHPNKETIKFLKDKIESAQLFIDAYNSRMQTLDTFVQEIISYQKEYFQEGDVMVLKPMKYEDIKERTGFSESTISRLANDKYMQTHFGNFKIKKLFTKSIENDKGESVSSDTIRNIITQKIKDENPDTPLTDQEIQNQLQEQGITLSRRTITKYRKQIGIESAGKRKSE